MNTPDGGKATYEQLLDMNAALRQTIAQQTQELQQERDKCDAIRNRFPVDAASWRGVDEQDLCAECGGSGTKLYSNTSTYHYSAGGQAMTLSVCDKCWGSGNKHKPWRSWKLADQQAQEVERLKKEVNDEVQTSLKYLGERNEKIKQLTDAQATMAKQAAELEAIRDTVGETEFALRQQVARLRECLVEYMTLADKICYAEPEYTQYHTMKTKASQALRETGA